MAPSRTPQQTLFLPFLSILPCLSLFIYSLFSTLPIYIPPPAHLYTHPPALLSARVYHYIYIYFDFTRILPRVNTRKLSQCTRHSTSQILLFPKKPSQTGNRSGVRYLPVQSYPVSSIPRIHPPCWVDMNHAQFQVSSTPQEYGSPTPTSHQLLTGFRFPKIESRKAYTGSLYTSQHLYHYQSMSPKSMSRRTVHQQSMCRSGL